MIYDLKLKDSENNEINLADYKGKVLLIVNTAIKCGLTPQYAELQELYDKYKGDGFEILDFPCNQFAEQSPGTNEEIKNFCTGRFGITFKQFAKIDVNGRNESPLYTLLKSQKKGMFSSKIKWNFTKFLISKNGEVLYRFSPTTSPKYISKKIESLISE